MGNFYVNYTLKGASPQAVANALAGRTAAVTPESNGCVVLFDEASDEQDETHIQALGARLSRDLNCVVWALLNHDDDILSYQLYANGGLVDEYNSAPGYWTETDDSGFSPPSGGDARKLCAAFGAADPDKVESILRRSSFNDEDDDGYGFEVDRHADLVAALGLPDFGVGLGWRYIDEGELPDGLDEDDLIIIR